MRLWVSGSLVCFLLMAPVLCFAEGTKYMRIGTGGVGGNYYPIGQMLAQIIGNPTGKKLCYSGATCGVSGLLAVAQTSNGSVSNVNAIARGDIEAGFVQSDIFYLATNSLEMFQDNPRAKNIRVIASLYQEQLQLVVRKSANINTVSDLKGKRVSLDIPGSGTIVDARIILKAYGLSENDLVAVYNKANIAVVKMLDNELDAFFVVSGHPMKLLVELSNKIDIDLVEIEKSKIEKITSEYGFLSAQTIPANVYRNVDEKNTIGVSALWVVSQDANDELVYQITREFWNELERKDYSTKHPLSSQMKMVSAVNGVGKFLHPGSRKYYDEKLASGVSN